MKNTFYSLMIGLLCFGCEEEVSQAEPVLDETYTFDESMAGWEGGFSDYPIGEDDFYELSYDREPLPAPLDQAQYALKLSGSNRSDDLFMFIKKELKGLAPDSRYMMQVSIRLASNAPEESVGIGGSPGASVYLKVGATKVEPTPVQENDYWQMNIDKGNQSQGGADMQVIGNIGTQKDIFEYTLITRSTPESLLVETDENGILWLIIGTDSGFEGTTTLYYNQIDVRLELLE